MIPFLTSQSYPTYQYFNFVNKTTWNKLIEAFGKHFEYLVSQVALWNKSDNHHQQTTLKHSLWLNWVSTAPFVSSNLEDYFHKSITEVNTGSYSSYFPILFCTRTLTVEVHSKANPNPKFTAQALLFRVVPPLPHMSVSQLFWVKLGWKLTILI